MDPESVRALASNYGFEEVFSSIKQQLLIFESSKEDVSSSYVITVWYASLSAGVVLPHPRRGRTQSFFFNLNNAKLRDIFSNPGQNRRLHYVGSAWVTHLPTDVESEESAIRRQLATVLFEFEDLKREQQVLEMRLEELERGDRKIKEVNRELFERQKTQPPQPTEQVRKRIGSVSSNNDYSTQTIFQRNQLKNSASLINSSDATTRVTPRSSSASAANISTNVAVRRDEDENDDEDEDEGEEEEEDEDDVEEQTNGRAAAAAESGGDTKTFASQKSVFTRTTSIIDRDSPARFKGNRCLFSFSNEEYQEEFGKSWSMKSVNCVALGRGYIIVYDDGGVAWWDVPSALDRKFRDVETVLPPVQYAAMGPEGNYFVKFENGKMEWVAKGSFQQQIKAGVSDRLLYVDKVALGPNGCWIILWTNGSVDYEGVPSDLAAVLKNIPNGPGLRDVSLGSHGEWFTIFKDHSVQANNLPDSLHAALARVKMEGGRVRSVAFGELSSWYIRYWDGK